MSKFSWQGKRVWLTGASSGIGAAIAKQLLAHDCKLIFSARNLAALEELSSACHFAKPLLLPFDVTDKGAHFDAVQAIKECYGGLDVVIFNAGTCVFYDPQNFSSEAFENLINANFFSVVYGIEASLPLLRESSSAIIAATSSIAAYDGLPFGMGAYCASKAALSIMLKSLAIDLFPENIHVLSASPGFVDTPLAKKNPFKMPVLISSEQAAVKILRAIEKKHYIVDFPKRLSMCFRCASKLPRSWYVFIMNKMASLLG